MGVQFCRRPPADPPAAIVVPRCRHGRILLGCPHDDCVEQREYLDDVQRALDAFNAQLRDVLVYRWWEDES